MSLIFKYSRAFCPNAETFRKVSTKKLSNKLLHLKLTHLELSPTVIIYAAALTQSFVLLVILSVCVCVHDTLRNSYPPTGKLYADEKKNRLFLLLSYHQCGPLWKGSLLNAFLRAGKHISLASKAN